MKNGLSVAVLLTVLLCCPPHSLSAQVVQRGLMLEYNEELAKSPLGGVEVVVRGAPSSVSDASGGFELEFLTQSGGDRVSVTRIGKPGYEIFNKEALEQWNINPDEPFRIVMCESGRFKRIRDNYSRVSSESYARQQASEESRLRELLEEGTLKEEEYRKKLYELKVEYQTKLDDLESYVDRFARIDLSELDEAEREIIRLVQAGDMEGAIARYEAQDLVGKYRAETEDIREIETARKSLDEAERAKMEGRDSLFAAVRRQFETYVLAGGEENYEKAGNLLREVALADTTNLEAVWEYAEFAMNQNDHRQAKRFYGIAYRQCSTDTSDLWRLSAIQNQLGTLYKAERDYASALTFYEAAYEIQERIRERYGFAGDYTRSVVLAGNLGGLYRSEGKYADAKKMYLSALGFLRNLLEDEGDSEFLRSEMAIEYQNLGGVSQDMGDYDEAEDYLKSALSIRDSLFLLNPGRYLSVLANSQQSLGNLYLGQSDYAEAGQLLQKALSNRQLLYDLNPDAFREDFAETNSSLGALYLGTGQYDLAEKHMLEALNNYGILYEMAPEVYSVHVAMEAERLGQLYLAKSDYLKSKHYLQTALKYSEILGPEQLYHIQMLSGGVLLAEGEYAKAEQMYLKALSSYELAEVSGKSLDRVDYVVMYNDLGAIKCVQKQLTESEAHLLKALELVTSLFSDNRYGTREVFVLTLIQRNLALLYNDAGMSDMSEHYFIELEQSYEYLVAEGEESYLKDLKSVWKALGWFCMERGDYAEALEYYQSALGDVTDIDPILSDEDKAFVVESLTCIARCHSMLGNYRMAIDMIDKAIDYDPMDSALYSAKTEILMKSGIPKLIEEYLKQDD